MKYGLIAHSFPWLGCMIYHSRANLMLFSEKTKKSLKSWSIRLVFAEPVTIIVLVSGLCSAWARFIQWPVTSAISPAPIGRIAFMSRDRQSTTIWHGSKIGEKMLIVTVFGIILIIVYLLSTDMLQPVTDNNRTSIIFQSVVVKLNVRQIPI